MKCSFFPVEIFNLVDLQHIQVVSKTDKQYKQTNKQTEKKPENKNKNKQTNKKGTSAHFPVFSPSNSHFPFLLHFAFFFSLPLFSQLVSTNFPVKNVRETLCSPPPPRLLRHWVSVIKFYIIQAQRCQGIKSDALATTFLSSEWRASQITHHKDFQISCNKSSLVQQILLKFPARKWHYGIDLHCY